MVPRETNALRLDAGRPEAIYEGRDEFIQEVAGRAVECSSDEGVDELVLGAVGGALGTGAAAGLMAVMGDRVDDLAESLGVPSLLLHGAVGALGALGGALVGTLVSSAMEDERSGAVQQVVEYAADEYARLERLRDDGEGEKWFRQEVDRLYDHSLYLMAKTLGDGAAEWA